MSGFLGGAGGRPLEPVEEPAPGVRPDGVRRPRGEAERLGRLADGQAGEVAKLDQLGGRPVGPLQGGQGLVQGEQVVGAARRRDVHVFERDAPPTGPPLAGLLAAGALDEDAAHRLGRRGEEVTAAVPLLPAVGVHQPQVSFVHQGGRLEGVAGRLGRQPGGGQFAQLAVDERQEFGRGLRVAGRGRVQQLGDGGHAAQTNRPRRAGQAPADRPGPGTGFPHPRSVGRPHRACHRPPRRGFLKESAAFRIPAGEAVWRAPDRSGPGVGPHRTQVSTGRRFMAVPRPGQGKPFAPGPYSYGGRSLVLAADGGIKVRPGDTISGYSGCLYRDVLVGWEEYGRDSGGTVTRLDDPNRIVVGQTVYHIPTWAARKAPAPTPTPPPPAPDTRLFTLTFRHGGVVPGTAQYESAVTLAGPVSGIFRGTIYPDNLTKFGRIQDGHYDLSLTLHKKTGTPEEKDLVVKTGGVRRPALTVNFSGLVPMIKQDGSRYMGDGINVHNGFYGERGSEGCLTIDASEWSRFIRIFLDRDPDLSDWFEGNGSWRGRKIGKLIVQA